MNYDNAQGAPLMAAVIVLIAIVIIGSVSFAFQGHVQF